MDKRQQVVADFFQGNCQVVFLVFDREGRVLDSNEFTRNLLGPKAGSLNFSDIFIDFSHTLSLPELASGQSAPKMLSLNTCSQAPQTFYFYFKDLGDEIIALGQPDYQVIEKLQQNLVQISGQLSNLNRELQKKNVELAGLNDLKNRFIGMAAHDLRSPIGHIMTCSDFLLEDAADRLDDPEKEFLDIIRKSSQFMLALIDDMLDITVIEAGKLNLDIRPADLSQVLKKNIELNRLIAEQKQIKLNLIHCESPPLVDIDVMKIEQVLNNLISNALKYSPPGTTVDVAMFCTDQNIVISVKDQGQGITEEEINNIFKPFTRTINRAADGEKSTGLGLAIVQSIIIGHQGRIWVESTPGQETTFYFSLPISQESK